MNLIEGIDYFVYRLDLPNCGGIGLVTPNSDGTYSIYLNTRFPVEVQQEKLRHELRHLEQEHFSRDDCTIDELEHSADTGDSLPPCGACHS